MEILGYKKAGMLIPHDEYIEQYNKIKEGVNLKIKITQPRNVKYHRKYFKFLSNLQNMLDGYGNLEHLRYEMMIQIGRYDMHLTINKKVIPIPHSISFERMDQYEFEEIVSQSVDVALKMLSKQNKNLSIKQLIEYEDILISFFN